MREPARFTSLKYRFWFPFVHRRGVTLVYQIWFGNPFSHEYRIAFQRRGSDFDWCQWALGVKLGCVAGCGVGVEIELNGITSEIQAFEFVEYLSRLDMPNGNVNGTEKRKFLLSWLEFWMCLVPSRVQ